MVERSGVRKARDGTPEERARACVFEIAIAERRNWQRTDRLVSGEEDRRAAAEKHLPRAELTRNPMSAVCQLDVGSLGGNPDFGMEDTLCGGAGAGIYSTEEALLPWMPNEPSLVCQ